MKGEHRSVPRYYFHLECDGATILDHTGSELRDVDQARAAARASAHNLLSGRTDAAVNWANGIFVVTDETGEIVLDVAFSEVADEDAQAQAN